MRGSFRITRRRTGREGGMEGGGKREGGRVIEEIVGGRVQEKGEERAG